MVLSFLETNWRHSSFFFDRSYQEIDFEDLAKLLSTKPPMLNLPLFTKMAILFNLDKYTDRHVLCHVLLSVYVHT